MWSAEPNQWVEAELADLAPADAIDLAAGEGRNAVWLAQRGWNVTAVDFSPVALEKTHQRAEANHVAVRTQQADLREWSPAPASVDLALIVYRQLPRHQEASMLGAAARAVRPAGTWFFVAHDLSNLHHGYGGPQDPAVLPDVDLVVNALPGLDIQRAEVVIRLVDTDDGPRAARDTLVVASRRA